MNVQRFYADGVLDEIDESGNHIPGNWHFTNPQETEYMVTNSSGDFPGTIVKLDQGHFNFYYHASDGTTRYGELIPAHNPLLLIKI